MATAKQVDDIAFDADGPFGRAAISTMRGPIALSNGDQIYWTSFHAGRQRIKLTESLTKKRLVAFQMFVQIHAAAGGECRKAFLKN